MRRAHCPRHEHVLLPTFDGRNAPAGDRVAFQAGFVRVSLANLATVDGRRAEVALDGAGEDVREGDARMLNGEGLVKVQGRRLGGRVDRAGRRGDGGGERVNEED